MENRVLINEQTYGEIHYLYKLIYSFEPNEFDKMKIYYGESPDFIIESKVKKIGIELTQYDNFDNDNFKQWIDRLHYFMNLIEKKLFNKKEIDYSRFSFYGYTSDFKKINKRGLEDVIEDFYNELIKYSNNNEMNIQREYYYENKLLFKYDILLPNKNLKQVGYSIGGYLAQFEKEFKKEIIKSIDRKNRKIPYYKRSNPCDEYWLLLHPPIDYPLRYDEIDVDKILDSIEINDINYSKIFIIRKDKVSIKEI